MTVRRHHDQVHMFSSRVLRDYLSRIAVFDELFQLGNILQFTPQVGVEGTLPLFLDLFDVHQQLKLGGGEFAISDWGNLQDVEHRQLGIEMP